MSSGACRAEVGAGATAEALGADTRDERRAKCAVRRGPDESIHPATLLEAAHVGPRFTRPRPVGWNSQVKSPPGPRMSRGVAMGASPLSDCVRNGGRSRSRSQRRATTRKVGVRALVEALAMGGPHSRAPADRSGQRAVRHAVMGRACTARPGGRQRRVARVLADHGRSGSNPFQTCFRRGVIPETSDASASANPRTPPLNMNIPDQRPHFKWQNRTFPKMSRESPLQGNLG